MTADTGLVAIVDTTVGRVARTATRWGGVGTSTHDEAWTAGRDAVEQARDGRSAELVVLYSCDRSASPELLAGAAEGAGSARVIGCSVPGDLAPDGPGENRVLALALGGSGFSVRTAVAPSHDGPRAAGRHASEQLVRSLSPDQRDLVMLLTASQAGDQSEIVRGAYGVLGGAVPLVGGCTGKNTSAASSYQFHGEEMFVDAVVAASLHTDGPFGIGVRHGLSRVGKRMVVTRSEGGHVLELDGQPALDAYLERLEAPSAAATDPDAFLDFAAAHPLGLSRNSGPDQARCIGAAGFEDRSLRCVAEVPQDSLAWFLHETVETTVAAAERACEEAVAGLNGTPPAAVLVFDCIGRRKLLGEDGARAEVAAIAGAAQGAPLAGFYTHGEIARTRGSRGFHNKTVVVLALG
jgi:hypothetical protein